VLPLITYPYNEIFLKLEWLMLGRKVESAFVNHLPTHYIIFFPLSRGKVGWEGFFSPLHLLSPNGNAFFWFVKKM